MRKAEIILLLLLLVELDKSCRWGVIQHIKHAQFERLPIKKLRAAFF